MKDVTHHLLDLFNACPWDGSSHGPSSTATDLPRLSETASAEAKRSMEQLRSGFLPVRHAAATRLAALGPGVIPHVRPVLQAGGWSFQIEGALDTAKRLGDPRLIPDIAALLHDDAPPTRLAAVRNCPPTDGQRLKFDHPIWARDACCSACFFARYFRPSARPSALSAPAGLPRPSRALFTCSPCYS